MCVLEESFQSFNVDCALLEEEDEKDQTWKEKKYLEEIFEDFYLGDLETKADKSFIGSLIFVRDMCKGLTRLIGKYGKRTFRLKIDPMVGIVNFVLIKGVKLNITFEDFLNFSFFELDCNRNFVRMIKAGIKR